MSNYLLFIIAVWVLGTAWGFKMISLFYIVLAAAAALYAVIWKCRIEHFVGKSVVLVALTVVSFTVSWGYAAYKSSLNHSALPASVHEESVMVEGIIVSRVEIDGDRVQFVLKSDHLKREESTALIQERFMVYIKLKEQQEQFIAATWSRGDRIILEGELAMPLTAGNFGAFDYREYLRLQHIHWQIFVDGLEAVSMNQESRGYGVQSWLGWRDQLQQRLSHQLDRLFTESETAGFMKGLLLGYKEDLDPEQFEQFSRLGLTHILAISGLHVGVISGMLLLMLQRVGLTRERAIWIVMLVVPLYVLLTGASPSAVRAGIMTLLSLIALRRNMLKQSIHFVALAAWLMLVFDPYLIYNVSFQLSFIVTLGLIWVTPRLYRKLLGPKAIRSLLSVTFTAQWVSFPITIYYFNQFSMLSWAANFVIVPVISLGIFPLSLTTFILSFIVPDISHMLAIVLTKSMNVLFQFVEWMAQWNFLHTIWMTPPLLWVVIYYTMLSWAVYEMKLHDCLKPWQGMKKLKHLNRVRMGMCAMGFMLLICYHYLSPILTEAGQVSFLDVGQGDSSLIVTPEHTVVLVDGGGTVSFGDPKEKWRQRKDPYEVGKDTLVPLMKQRGISHIDYVIASHGDADHIQGLIAVLDRFSVGALFINGVLEKDSMVEELIETAFKRSVPIYIPSAGETLQLDRHTSLHFLYPQIEENSARKIVWNSDQNERSIVMLLEMYDSTVLYTGDMGISEEKELVNQLKEQGTVQHRPVDILKVAHHGSKYSTSEEWIEYWQPLVSIISVGSNNVYGHPAQETLLRLKEVHSKVFRTDLHGEIQFQITTSGIRMRMKKIDGYIESRDIK